MAHILAIDQGTTSTRAMVFDGELRVVAEAQREFPQHYPASGWVEHDPEDLWTTALETCREAAARLDGEKIAAIGIANQRETTLIWDRATGRPIANAIVWQDRRTAPLCAELKAAGHEAMVTERCGLLLDPYFSGTKAAWLLDNVEGARARAERGELVFGTVDSWLLWRLTGGAHGGRHVTDATNASRTLLYDIRRGCWGRGPLPAARRADGDAARGAGHGGRFRHDGRSRARRADPRRRRRPAGGDDRAGLLSPGHDQVDLRHRLLRGAEHRRDARRVVEPAADDYRLPAGRAHDLCSGRLDLRRRRRGAVAARRAGGDRQRRRDGRSGRAVG